MNTCLRTDGNELYVEELHSKIALEHLLAEIEWQLARLDGKLTDELLEKFYALMMELNVLDNFQDHWNTQFLEARRCSYCEYYKSEKKEWLTKTYEQVIRFIDQLLAVLEVDIEEQLDIY